MHDLDVFHRLGDDDLDPALIEELQELAALPFNQRLPFFARTLKHRRHSDPVVRQLVLQVVSGAYGLRAVETVVFGLNDDDPEVRAAAVEALSAAFPKAPLKIVHALFHARSDVRRSALMQGVQLHSLLAATLLADNETHELVTAQSDLLLSNGEALLAALSVTNYLGGRQRFRDVVLNVDWQKRLPGVLATVDAPKYPKPVENPAVLQLHLRSFEGDPLIRLLDALLDFPVFSEALANIGGERWIQRQHGVRLGWALTQLFQRRGDLSPRLLAVASLQFPSVLGLTDLPIALRREAARQIVDLNPPAQFDDLVSILLPSGVMFSGGRLDLKACVGLFRLSRKPPIESIASHLTVADWTDAIRRQPNVGVELLRRTPSPACRQIRTELIEDLVKNPSGESQLVVEVVAAAPEAQHALTKLSAAVVKNPALWQQLLAAAKTRELGPLGRFGDKRRRRLCKWLGQQMTSAEVVQLTSSLVAKHPSPDASLETLIVELTAPEYADALANHVRRLWKDEQLRFGLWVKEAAYVASPLFHALMGALKYSPHREARDFARDATSEARGGPAPAQTSGAVRALTRSEHKNLADADEVALRVCLEVCFRESVSGVAAALLERPAPVPRVDACVALLFSHDPPELVCEAFDIYYEDDADFLGRIEELMVDRGRKAAFLPLLGAAWLHRWETPLASLETQVAALRNGIEDAIQQSDVWSSKLLVSQFWQGLARLAGFLFSRKRAQFDLLFTDEVARLSADHLPSIGEPAAKIVAEYFRADDNATLLTELKSQVTVVLHETNKAARELLSRWMDTALNETSAASTTVSADVADIEMSTDAKWLANLACLTLQSTAAAALARLEILQSKAATDALLARVRSGPVGRGRLVGAALLRMLKNREIKRLLNETNVSGALRFELGLPQLKRNPDMWPAVAHAINTPGEGNWMHRGDLKDILQTKLSPLTIAYDVLLSDQTTAYTFAVQQLVEDRLDDQATEALFGFLHSDRPRVRAVRTLAAQALFENGHAEVLPVVLTAALDAWKEDHHDKENFVVSQIPSVSEEVATCLAAAGDPEAQSKLLQELFVLTHHEREGALLEILKQAPNKKIEESALSMISRESGRHSKLHALAEVFTWGVREARFLLGRGYRIHLIGGKAYGYTRLEEASVFVNPLAFLRGQHRGRDVLEGLIMHELGHHAYHADEEGLAIWKTAEKARLHQLLNLVADEHLERRLRARDASHGDRLKSLAAHAFQHADRCVNVLGIVRRLGPQSFSVLSAAELEAAAAPDDMVVNLGDLFRQLEEGGTSFARFVRALRMGLGNRHGDPKVAEGLALFKKKDGLRFRERNMTQLWDITQELVRIFGDEVDLMDVLDLHDNVDADANGSARERIGISDEAVQREVDRLLDGRKDKKSKGSREINRGKDESFDELRDVQKVACDPALHRDLQRNVTGAARRLRDVLSKLGLQMEPRRQRLRGRSVDRPGLPRALIKGDPRMLVARDPVYRADLSLSVVIDCSGSMSMGDHMERAKLFGVLLAEATRGLRGVDARFFGFTDVTLFDAGTAERCAVSSLEAGGGNNDAGALWYAAQTALRSTRKAKVLVMISDGSPTECTVAALRDLVKKLERKRGFVCAQVAVHPLEDRCFSHHVDLHGGEVDMAVRRFGQLVSKLVRGALAQA